MDSEVFQPKSEIKSSMKQFVLLACSFFSGQYGDCCRCMKMKACEDTGCKAKEGTCVDVRNEDLEKYSDLDLSNDLGNDLCGAMHEETFCKCFKKRSQSTPDQYTLDDDYFQYDADYETTTTQNLE